MFEKFATSVHSVPPGFTTDFLGQLTKADHRYGISEADHSLPVPRNDEIYEWIAVLESALAAESSYTMVDLGAGYGRWLVRAACAIRIARPQIPTRFVAVEAEPTHFQWLREHLQYNKISLNRCTLVNAPITGKVETVHFTVGHADEWYGQAVIPEGSAFGNWPNAKVVKMKSTIIPALIAELDSVDLVDMDIQGAELPCIESSIAELNAKVRRLFISTHSDEIHERIFAILTKAGWLNEASYLPKRQHNTDFGPILFGDGIQYWVNGRSTLGHKSRFFGLFRNRTVGAAATNPRSRAHQMSATPPHRTHTRRNPPRGNRIPPEQLGRRPCAKFRWPAS